MALFIKFKMYVYFVLVTLSVLIYPTDIQGRSFTYRDVHCRLTVVKKLKASCRQVKWIILCPYDGLLCKGYKRWRKPLCADVRLSLRDITWKTAKYRTSSVLSFCVNMCIFMHKGFLFHFLSFCSLNFVSMYIFSIKKSQRDYLNSEIISHLLFSLHVCIYVLNK